jgi:hypothetical protein
MEAQVSRRLFVGLCLSGAFPTEPVLAQPAGDVASLLAGRYVGEVALRLTGGQYLGPDFRLAPAPTRWILRPGRYDGRFEGDPVHLSGYWIYHPDSKRCWQAAGGMGPRLAYWNEDGRATGLPEDWELFAFSRGDGAQVTISKLNHRKLACYVVLKGDQFSLHSRTLPETNPEAHPKRVMFSPEF